MAHGPLVFFQYSFINFRKAGQQTEPVMKKERRPVEDGVVIIDCGPCLQRFGLVKLARLFPPELWFVKDICGIICVVLTWLLIVYAEYVVMFIMLIPAPNPAYGLANMILFQFLAFLALASHSKAMVTDPVSIIGAQHTKTNKMTCVPSKDLDKHGHLHSLVRVFSVSVEQIRRVFGDNSRIILVSSP